MEGTIVKGYSGFYYVYTEDGIYECSLRGKNKLKNVKFLPGDQVKIEIIKNKKGVVEEVLPRKNRLIRPPIANVDQILILSAFKKPQADFKLIDRLTVAAVANKIEPVICFNKKEYSTEEEREKIRSIYRKSNFKLLFCSAETKEGLQEVREVLKAKKTVLAGQSGVGKSSLLNSLQENLSLEVGEVSKKLKRGRHTTRHVELMYLDFGALVADTPGFTSLDFPHDIEKENLALFYPEFLEHRGECRFNSCIHRNEPSCRIKELVEIGEISQERYENYLYFLEEINSRERRY